MNDAEKHGPILSNMIHYGGDSGLTDNYRKGTLYFVHNTLVVRADQDEGSGFGRWNTSLFDVSTSDETAVIDNNVVYVRSVTSGATPTTTAWARESGTLELGTNWATPGLIEWRTPDGLGGSITGLDNLLSNPENDPGFVSEHPDDFVPAAGSALVDAAIEVPAALIQLGVRVSNEPAGPSAGRARVVAGDGPDLGAFESTGTPQSVLAAAVAVIPAATSSPESSSAVLGDDSITDALVSDGKGPIGNDNGDRHPCGQGVRCVGGAGPYASINAAIADAETGDVIQVAGGTYAENVALGSFTALDPRHLTVLGGFSADFTERDAASRPTVDGGGADPAVQLHVMSDGTTVLDGFVLTNGLGLGATWEDGGGSGGAVFVQQQGDGELVISHNEITDSRTRAFGDEARGGGIHATAIDWDGSKPTVRIEHNRVVGNEAGRGAGIEVRGRAALIANNLVEGNLAHSDHGGGIYLSALHTTLTDNIVRANSVGATTGYGWGGGIFVGGVSADLVGNVIIDNAAPSMGSGVFWDEGATGTMTGDFVLSNRCPTDARSGAAIYLDGGEPGPSHVVARGITVLGHACDQLPDGGAILLEGGSTIELISPTLGHNGIDVLNVTDER